MSLRLLPYLYLRVSYYPGECNERYKTLGVSEGLGRRGWGLDLRGESLPPVPVVMRGREDKEDKKYFFRWFEGNVPLIQGE